MNFSIFSGWLKRLDEYVAQTNGRKIAPLIENASSHGIIQDLPVLPNVQVIYLTKNTTSCLQPWDARKLWYTLLKGRTVLAFSGSLSKSYLNLVIGSIRF